MVRAASLHSCQAREVPEASLVRIRARGGARSLCPTVGCPKGETSCAAGVTARVGTRLSLQSRRLTGGMGLGHQSMSSWASAQRVHHPGVPRG